MGLPAENADGYRRYVRFVSDLYRFELRRLRDRVVRGEIPKAGYFERVVALRRQYPLVSLKPHEWLVDGG